MVTRRETFAFLAGGLATAVIAPMGNDIYGMLRETAKSAFDRYDYDVGAIKGVFGPIDARASFIPGQSHPKYQGFHPDDEYVADIFDDLVKDAVENRVVYDTERIPQNLRGTALVSGSPVSNALSRYVLQFDYIDTTDRNEGLLRAEDPVFETEYEFILAKNALNEMGISEPIGKSGTTGNWSIVNRRTGDLYAAESRGGRLLSDFLLVTCLPNIFDRESYENGEGVFLLAGAHGVGTKAVDLLLRDSSLLFKLRETVGKSMYWQALFQVDGVDHYHEDPKFGVRWHPSSLNQSFEFSTVTFEDARLKELARWV